MNIEMWFNDLQEPNTIIALATLIVTSIGVFAGIRSFSSNQSVTGGNDCIVDNITQEATSETNSRQSVSFKNNSKITGVTQKQTK